MKTSDAKKLRGQAEISRFIGASIVTLRTRLDSPRNPLRPFVTIHPVSGRWSSDSARLDRWLAMERKLRERRS